MSLYNYVGTPNTNLVCCICRAPFTDPVTTITCQHTFCRDCILRALSHSSQCPVDRLPLSERELGHASPIVRSLVDELLVECVYKEEGCGHRGQRQLLAAHLKDDCPFSEDGKMRNVTAKAKGKIKGGNESGEREGRKEGKDSTDSEDQEWALPSDDIPEASPSTVRPSLHSATSAPCSTGSAEAGYLADPTSSDVPRPRLRSPRNPRLTQLTEQNILLRHRVGTLESSVQILRKEMSAVRDVLSPWMRNAVSSNSNLGSVSSLPGVEDEIAGLTEILNDLDLVDSRTSAARGQGRASSVSSGGEEQMGGESGSPGPTLQTPPENASQGSAMSPFPGTLANSGISNDGTQDFASGSGNNDLASYFPSQDEVRVRQSTHSARSQPQQHARAESESRRQRPAGVGHGQHSVLSTSNGINPMDSYQNMFLGLGLGHLGGGHGIPAGAYGTYPTAAGAFGGGAGYATSPLATIPPQLSNVPGAPHASLQPQPLSVSVPNLDTSSPSLLHTLHALHSTCVTLSSAVEEVNRKSDVALALMGGGSSVSMMGGGVVGEVLRLGEEVMGVRASVQGLRMQVHGMLMGAVGVGGIGTPGMNPGFISRPPPPPANFGSAGDEESVAGASLGQGAGQTNPRVFYPGLVPLGITKL